MLMVLESLTRFRLLARLDFFGLGFGSTVGVFIGFCEGFGWAGYSGQVVWFGVAFVRFSPGLFIRFFEGFFAYGEAGDAAV